MKADCPISPWCCKPSCGTIPGRFGTFGGKAKPIQLTGSIVIAITKDVNTNKVKIKVLMFIFLLL
ncbi:unnamed protein product [Moneuplotes crassus]|uniref:Uncharacterized protein n=1 Tax=Euplotes crassus TaxID=5936 RepID=A0AAD1YA60_EUPCR|nr:unnamed protein product [Moneuplotes crassus]